METISLAREYYMMTTDREPRYLFVGRKQLGAMEDSILWSEIIEHKKVFSLGMVPVEKDDFLWVG
jgi:hypothetical protein